LAQGESARGDRTAAVRYLERLAREAPQSALRGEAALWHGRLLVEGGMREEGCAVVRAGRLLVKPGELELSNRYEYVLRGCPEVAIEATPAAPAPETPRTPAPAPAPRPAETRQAPPSGPVWSVQAAAFNTRSEADGLVTDLKARGYDARVDGTAAPFRVRFGQFATRAEAAAASENYKARERADAFIVQVPRG
jgi:septal ring-binding cell division protein DamX